MKQDYINELASLLDLYEMDSQEKEDILSDYNDMYDHYEDYGMTHEQIRDKLGAPSSIIGDLTEGFRKQSEIKEIKASSRNTKITALSPFVALILFFVLGFAFNLWAYSWMAFLLIPVVAIIVNVGPRGETLIALSPFVALIGYGILGFVYNLWHPGWLIFLIIPVTAILTSVRKEGFLVTLTSLSPFIALTIFFVYFGERNEYVTGWLIFLIIPAIGVLNEKNLLKIILVELLIAGGAIGYLWIGATYDRYDWGLLAFVPLVAYGLLQANLRFWEIPKEYRIVALISIVVFVGLGLSSDLVGINMWGYAWMAFLAIPVFAIQRETSGNEKWIATMPFISLFLFYTLGYFFGWWAFSWLAFLLIPMFAIIKEA